MLSFAPLLSLSLLAIFLVSPAQAELTTEQQQISLEALPADPSLAKVVFLAGSPSNKPGQHEYFAGCALMMKWLKSVAGVAPVMVADGWPKNEAVLTGARCIVLYMDGGTKLPFLDDARWSRLQGLVEAGAGMVVLHQAIDCPAAKAAAFKSWFGAVFQPDIGCRGHWDVQFESLGQHPTLSGVKPFVLPKDGWLYNLHFMPAGVTPLLQSLMPDSSRKSAAAKANAGRPETVAWCYDRPDGGRSFGFTGCDLHSNWAEDNQRRLLLNGILWAAKLEVPPSGVSSVCTPTMLTQNLDRKVFAAKPKPTSKKLTKGPQ